MHLRWEARKLGGGRPPLRGLDRSCWPGHKSQECSCHSGEAAFDLDKDTGHLGFLSCPLQGQHSRPFVSLTAVKRVIAPEAGSCYTLGMWGARWHVGSFLGPQVACMWASLPSAASRPARSLSPRNEAR